MRRNAVVSRLRRTRTSSEKDKRPRPRSRSVSTRGADLRTSESSPSAPAAARSGQAVVDWCATSPDRGLQEFSRSFARKCQLLLENAKPATSPEPRGRRVPFVLATRDNLSFTHHQEAMAAQTATGGRRAPFARSGLHPAHARGADPSTAPIIPARYHH
jgi:hypothetical protein